MPYTPPDKENLLATFDRAPQSIQDALTDGVAIDFLLTVGNEYKVSPKLARVIIAMGRDVLIGLLQPIDFDKNLRELIGPSNATRLLKDFNEQVLTPLLSGRTVSSQKFPAPVGQVLMHTTPPASAPKPTMPPVPKPPIATVVPIVAKEPAKNVTLLPMTPPATQLPVKAAPVLPLQPLKVTTASPQMVPPQPTAKAVPTPNWTPPAASAPELPKGSPPSSPQVVKPGTPSPLPPAVPNLVKTGVPPMNTQSAAATPPKPSAAELPKGSSVPPAGPTTPLINKYSADPYRELPDIDK